MSSSTESQKKATRLNRTAASQAAAGAAAAAAKEREAAAEASRTQSVLAAAHAEHEKALQGLKHKHALEVRALKDAISVLQGKLAALTSVPVGETPADAAKSQ